MSKYKYYFKKPTSEISKDILKGLVYAGAIYFAASSPHFTIHLMRMRNLKKKKYRRKQVYDTFYNLKRQGYLDVRKSNHQIYISLTERGRKMAGRFQIDSLKINKPKKWDRRWRVVIFDIAQLKNFQRNAFRGKLKELGFFLLQKSVWIYPYPCKDEIELLREFFGLGEKEIRLITAENIENDDFLRKIFKLN
jgi:DNA-binding transcriptional regulator PaaX